MLPRVTVTSIQYRFGYGDGCIAFGFDDGQIFEFLVGNTDSVFDILRQRLRLVVGELTKISEI